MLDCWLWDVVDSMRHEEEKIIQKGLFITSLPTRGLTLWDVRCKIMHINPTKEIVMNTKRFMLHSVVLAIFTVFSAQSLFSKTVPFSHQPLLAGKASLTDNGFEVKRTLGTAAFAPELMMPIELVYSSSSENSGVFGYGWSSPQ
jgi:hypothetical protein